MRNKSLRWLLPALMLIGFVSSSQSAWNYEPVRWHHYSLNPGAGSGVGSFVGDTLFIPALAARADTTAGWNMLEAEPSPTGSVSLGSTGTTDSSQVGAVIIAGDSTVASTFAWGATTVQLQTNYGSNNSGWTSYGGTISPLPTTTQKAAIFPIFQLSVTTAHLGTTSNFLTYGMFAPQMRAIVTWGSGAAVPSARVYVRKWLGTGIVQTPRANQQINP